MPHHERKERPMTAALNVIIYPVKDVAQAKTLVGGLLEAEPYVDQPYYVGFRVGDLEVGLDPNGHGKGLTGPVAYWTVEDIEGILQRLLDAGAQVLQPVSDVGGGRLIASVKDADGNITGLLQEPKS
jgi:predicted enzyme related to lactoylglutathione lyase